MLDVFPKVEEISPHESSLNLATLNYAMVRRKQNLNQPCQLYQKEYQKEWMPKCKYSHYSDVIMGAVAQITSLTIVYSTVHSGADKRKHQSSVSLTFVRWPVNSPHKWPVTRKMFPFDDVIISLSANALKGTTNLNSSVSRNLINHVYL